MILVHHKRNTKRNKVQVMSGYSLNPYPIPIFEYCMIHILYTAFETIVKKCMYMLYEIMCERFPIITEDV